MIEAGTSLGKRGSQPPGNRPGETGAGAARIQNGVGKQATNGIREVGANGVVHHPVVGRTEEGGCHAESEQTRKIPPEPKGRRVIWSPPG